MSAIEQCIVIMKFGLSHAMTVMRKGHGSLVRMNRAASGIIVQESRNEPVSDDVVLHGPDDDGVATMREISFCLLIVVVMVIWKPEVVAHSVSMIAGAVGHTCQP